jgi:hypothetical protein
VAGAGGGGGPGGGGRRDGGSGPADGEEGAVDGGYGEEVRWGLTSGMWGRMDGMRWLEFGGSQVVRCS